MLQLDAMLSSDDQALRALPWVFLHGCVGQMASFERSKLDRHACTTAVAPETSLQKHTERKWRCRFDNESRQRDLLRCLQACRSTRAYMHAGCKRK